MAKQRNVSAIVGGAGFVAHLFTELEAAVRERGGTDEDIHRVVTPEGKTTIGEIADIIVRDGLGWRQLKEFSIELPALPRPTLEGLQALYLWIRSIEYDESPTEAVTLQLGTFLRPGEERINGAEYERRRKPHLVSCLGRQHALWLVEHQDELPEFMALLWKVHIDFPGVVAVSVDGRRHFAYLDRGGERWCLNWRWTGSGLISYGRVAFSK